MAKFFLVVEPSCLKKRVLKPKYAITNVDWNNLTFEFLAKDEQNLLGTTSNYLRSSQGTTRNFRAFQGLEPLFFELSCTQAHTQTDRHQTDRQT